MFGLGPQEMIAIGVSVVVLVVGLGGGKYLWGVLRGRRPQDKT